MGMIGRGEGEPPSPAHPSFRPPSRNPEGWGWVPRIGGVRVAAVPGRVPGRDRLRRGVTLTSVLSRRGRGGDPALPLGSGLRRNDDWGAGEGPATPGSHPHLNPLPSRERRGPRPSTPPLGSGLRRNDEHKGRVPSCRRRPGRDRLRRGVTLTSVLSRRGRGGGAPHLNLPPKWGKRGSG